jgi:hypothetical protein
MATVIRGLGGVMSESFAAAELYRAAAKGDVSTLHLLTKHAGVNVITKIFIFQLTLDLEI